MVALASRVSIMVVEDDEDVRCSLVQVLEDEGYDVSTAMNGRQALTMLGAASAVLPGLILLDLMMPVLDGHGFLAEQSRDSRLAEIPVLVLTASGDRPDGEVLPDTIDAGEGASRRQVPVLRKPFALSHLLSTVTSLCSPVRDQEDKG